MIEAKINAYGGESTTATNGSHMASSDYLEIIIPGDAFRHETHHHLLAEVVTDPLHLLKEDYDRAKEIKEELDSGDLDVCELEDVYDELRQLDLRPEDLDDIEVYDEMENYPALCGMIQDAMEVLAHRLVKPVNIPLGECGGEDITINPAEPYDEEDHSYDSPQTIEGVYVETI